VKLSRITASAVAFAQFSPEGFAGGTAADAEVTPARAMPALATVVAMTAMTRFLFTSAPFVGKIGFEDQCPIPACSWFTVRQPALETLRTHIDLDADETKRLHIFRCILGPDIPISTQAK
jgi:hypothetical protein